MQLGNILSTAKDPVVCKPVSFWVLGEQDGKQVRAKAEAVLAFVSEAARAEARHFAAASLGPGADLVVEEIYRFLMVALRDKDDPSRQFCPNGDIGIFRSAIIMDQVLWLRRQYDAFVRDEYPELMTPKQQTGLAEQAAGE